MKKTFLFATTGSALLLASQADAQTNAPSAIETNSVVSKMYVSGDVGAAWQQNINSHGNGTVNFDTGVRGDVTFGYNFCEHFAAELETGVIANSISSIAGNTLSSFGASASIYEIPILVNGIYKLPLNGGWTPYIGVGDLFERRKRPALRFCQPFQLQLHGFHLCLSGRSGSEICRQQKH